MNCDPDGVLALAQHGDPLRLEGWDQLRWIAMTDKHDAAELCARLGLNVIVENGLTDDGACTCGDRSENHMRSRGKHPIQNAWTTAPFDLEFVHRMLHKNWRNNIGIRTGMQPCGRGLVVVDVDGSRDLLEPLEQEAGQPFPSTLTARTGSGGLHLYYWLKDGVEVRNTQGLVPHVDIRGYGGQVVCAPSLHLSGNKYTWIDVCEPAVLP